MIYLINTIICILCFGASSAHADSSDQLVFGRGVGHYNLWSYPNDALLRDLENQADKDANFKCFAEAVRVSDYTTTHDYDHPLFTGRVLVTVSAEYTCTDKPDLELQRGDSLICLNDCMDKLGPGSFAFCHSKCPGLW